MEGERGTYLVELLLAQGVQAPPKGEDRWRDRVRVQQNGPLHTQPDGHRKFSEKGKGMGEKGRGGSGLNRDAFEEIVGRGGRGGRGDVPIAVLPELLVLLKDGAREGLVLLDRRRHLVKKGRGGQ